VCLFSETKYRACVDHDQIADSFSSQHRSAKTQEWCARVLRWLFESPASASCGERFRGRPGLPRNDVAFVSENGNRFPKRKR
jgi:hypothetical protein